MVLRFFFNDTATTEIYTLSLHDALPICSGSRFVALSAVFSGVKDMRAAIAEAREDKRRGRRTILFVDEIHRFKKADRKSTRLNSSHANKSYAVFCFKKKKIIFITLSP